jgi:hypothetical protein
VIRSDQWTSSTTSTVGRRFASATVVLRNNSNSLYLRMPTAPVSASSSWDSGRVDAAERRDEG